LGAARTEAARDALLDALNHRVSRARMAAASALGNWRGDAAVGRALARVVRQDQSYYAVGSAAAALGRARFSGAAPVLKAALRRSSHREVIRQQALVGLARLGDGEELPTILAMARPGIHQRVRGQALALAAVLAMDLPKESRRPVRETAEERLRDPLYFVRRGAIQALQTLGDPAAIGELQAAAERDVEGAVRIEARVAIERLRAGGGPDEALKRLRDEVDELRRRERELSDRVSRLEPAPAAKRPTAKPKSTTTRSSRTGPKRRVR
jgi:aminopeptidase N